MVQTFTGDYVVPADLEDICGNMLYDWRTCGVKESNYADKLAPWFTDRPEPLPPLPGEKWGDYREIDLPGPRWNSDRERFEPDSELGDGFWRFLMLEDVPYSPLLGVGTCFTFIPGLGNQIWWSFSFDGGGFCPFPDKLLPVTDEFADWMTNVRHKELIHAELGRWVDKDMSVMNDGTLSLYASVLADDYTI